MNALEKEEFESEFKTWFDSKFQNNPDFQRETESDKKRIRNNFKMHYAIHLSGLRALEKLLSENWKKVELKSK